MYIWIQELQLFLTKTEVPGGYLVVARSGNTLQQLQVASALPRWDALKISKVVVRCWTDRNLMRFSMKHMNSSSCSAGNVTLFFCLCFPPSIILTLVLSTCFNLSKLFFGRIAIHTVLFCSCFLLLQQVVRAFAQLWILATVPYRTHPV